MAITCDGAAHNRRFYKMHFLRRSSLTYKIKNILSDDDRDIYFMFDTPHLMKTTRNCWSNSFGHSHSRMLQLVPYCIRCTEKWISWVHLQLVNKSRQSSGLSLLKKITKEHLQLDSYSRMQVNLAVQVGITYCIQ